MSLTSSFLNTKKQTTAILTGLAVVLFFSACRPDEPAPVLPTAEPEEEYSGGANLTSFDRSENAFGRQAKNLTFEEDGLFVVGNSLFQTNWVTPPASVQSLDGLGPLFNVSSCGGCHFKDGRAKLPATTDAPLNGLLFRLSVPGAGPHGAPLGEPNYGGQLQDRSVIDAQPEGRVRISFDEIPGQYPDGTAYSLRRPRYEFMQLLLGDFDPSVQISPRIAQQIPGLGLLENITESTLLALADENDSDKNGISGRPNYVWNVEKQQISLGRFGWKANVPTIRQQTAGAFVGDMGLTSSLFPEVELTPAEFQMYSGLPNGGLPELTDEQLRKVVFYIQTLSVPARRDVDDPTVLQGKALFTQINCSGCHVPKLQTGSESAISVLNNQTIRPFTDLLLHDMGEGLADHRPDFQADGQEWRTPPLWGIGMIPTVNKHTTLLHDGRARNAEEAILWHGGEAEASKESFKKLSKEDRAALLRFLESL